MAVIRISDSKGKAWIGDAILSYHVRLLILARYKMQLGWVYTRVVNNLNLQKFGRRRGLADGTAVEAEIYRLHLLGGRHAQDFVEEIFESTIAQFSELEKETLRANAEQLVVS